MVVLSVVEPLGLPPLLQTVGILQEVSDGRTLGGGGGVVLLILLSLTGTEEDAFFLER